MATSRLKVLLDRFGQFAMLLAGTSVIALGCWIRYQTWPQFALVAGSIYLACWWIVLSVSSDLSRFKQRFVLFHLAVGFCLVCIEFGGLLCRLDGRVLFGTVEDEQWKNPLNRTDPELLHVRQPNLHLQGVQPTGDIAHYCQVPTPTAYPYDVSFDERGFRNPPNLTQADVAVVGDSFVESDLTMTQDLFTSVLAREQQTKVANFGQLWYGPQQIAVVLERYALAVKPKIVFWFHFEGNDLSDYHRYEATKLVLAQIESANRSLKNRSLTLNMFKALFLQTRKSVKPVANQGTFRDSAGKETQLYFYYPGEPLSARDIETLTKLGPYYQKASERCKSAGAQLVVVFAPTKFRVHQPACKVDPELPISRWQLNDHPTRLKSMLHELDPSIKFLDLTEPLRAESLAGSLTYFVDDTHWSVAGQKVVARELGRMLPKSTD